MVLLSIAVLGSWYLYESKLTQRSAVSAPDTISTLHHHQLVQCTAIHCAALHSELLLSAVVSVLQLCAGAIRSKNTMNILLQTILDAAVSAICWYLIG